MSKTYVNEIDVSKVKTEQHVEMVVDAFPEKSYTGTVTSVANIGEQLPNADAKVFEVLIEVDGTDPILRPSMTTGNKIVTKTINDVTFIPLESVQAGPDSIPFVYLKNGTRQVVVLGESNENNVVVEQGLQPGTLIYLSTPLKAENFKLVGEELIAVIRERENIKKAEELRLRTEVEKAKAEGGEMMGRGGMQGRPGMNITPEMMQRFQSMRGNQPGGPGGTRDTAAMRRMMNMRNNQQGGIRDTSARRRFNRQPGQQGEVRDTSARRRTFRQPDQQSAGQNGQVPAQTPIKK
jgi:hypothetical protein